VTLAALGATLWGAVTGFYGTRRWTPIDACMTRLKAKCPAL
jgi:hypothetical protein